MQLVLSFASFLACAMYVAKRQEKEGKKIRNFFIKENLEEIMKWRKEFDKEDKNSQENHSL